MHQVQQMCLGSLCSDLFDLISMHDSAPNTRQAATRPRHSISDLAERIPKTVRHLFPYQRIVMTGDRRKRYRCLCRNPVLFTSALANEASHSNATGAKHPIVNYRVRIVALST